MAVVPLDDEPAGHVTALLADGWFDLRVLTEDDHRRPARYRAEADRHTFLHSFDSLDGYLRPSGGVADRGLAARMSVRRAGGRGAPTSHLVSAPYGLPLQLTVGDQDRVMQQVFDHAGHSVRRTLHVSHTLTTRHHGTVATLVTDLTTGGLVDLTRAADEAFWTWAIVETLRPPA